jgi:hypothetical protein
MAIPRNLANFAPKLDSSGNPTFTAPTVFSAGTASDPSITFTGDTNTGLFSPAADTIAFTEGGAEAMRITSDGSLGIGTTSPNYPLNVQGSGDTFVGITGGTSNVAALLLGDADNKSLGRVSYDNSDNSLQFWADGSERARIASDGAFLVGCTATPSGSIGGSGFITGTNSRRPLHLATTVTAGNTLAVFTNPNGQVGFISVDGSSTLFQTSSDYRLKHDIQPMTGALAKVQQLKPVTYKWNADDSNGEGFIAHELAEVVPQCVSGEKDEVETYTDEEGNEQIRPVYQGVDTSFLVATLTAAIQELKAELDQAKTRIAALEAQ